MPLQEKRIVLAKAENVAAECEQKARFSEQTKKSALAVACVCLFALSGQFLINSMGWVMHCDTLNSQGVPFSRIMEKLSTEEIRYFDLQAMLFGACITGSVLAGYENMTGYHTNKHNFIKNFFYQSFSR